jgi:hypothetical protein
VGRRIRNHFLKGAEECPEVRLIIDPGRAENRDAHANGAQPPKSDAHDCTSTDDRREIMTRRLDGDLPCGQNNRQLLRQTGQPA